MPQNYYADAEPAATAAPASPTQTTSETAEDSPTAELPKALLGGKKFEVGDRVELEVVQIMEDSVLVKYYTGDEEEEPAPEPEPEPGGAEMGGGGGGGGNPGGGYGAYMG